MNNVRYSIQCNCNPCCTMNCNEQQAELKKVVDRSFLVNFCAHKKLSTHFCAHKKNCQHRLYRTGLSVLWSQQTANEQKLRCSFSNCFLRKYMFVLLYVVFAQICMLNLFFCNSANNCRNWKLKTLWVICRRNRVDFSSFTRQKKSRFYAAVIQEEGRHQ